MRTGIQKESYWSFVLRIIQIPRCDILNQATEAGLCSGGGGTGECEFVEVAHEGVDPNGSSECAAELLSDGTASSVEHVAQLSAQLSAPLPASLSSTCRTQLRKTKDNKVHC